MSGIIITVLALVTGLPLMDLAVATAWLSVPAVLAMAACIPWFLPPADGGWRLLPEALGAGLLVSLVVLAAVLTVGVALSGMVGGLALMGVLLLLGPRRHNFSRQLGRDLLPFACIFVPLLLVNTVPWLHDLTSRRWVLDVRLVPIHQITLTPLFSAYLYLFLALGVALAVFREVQRRPVLATGLSQGWRALIAMGLFGAMGQIIAYSGYAEGFVSLTEAHNIPWVLAMGLKAYTGSLYPVFVPLLGWVGTFLTGYGVASLMLFGDLQVHAAALAQRLGGVSGRGPHRGRRPRVHLLALQDRHRRAHVRRPGAGRPDSAAHHPPGPGRLLPHRLDPLGLITLLPGPRVIPARSGLRRRPGFISRHKLRNTLSL